MTLIDDIKNTLTAYDITGYTDETIEVFIENAKRLIGEPLCEDKEYTDYILDFEGDTVITDFYPVKTVSSLTINDKPIALTHINPNGVLYLPYPANGVLSCTYTVGINQTEFEQDLIPVVVKLIQNKEGGNIGSVSEGDVSVSYDNTMGNSTSLDTLINNIRNKYGAMVRLI